MRCRVLPPLPIREGPIGRHDFARIWHHLHRVPVSSPLLLLLLMAAEAVPQPTGNVPKIVGGTRVEAGEWMSVVAIGMSDASTCTGVLIDPDTVLTAAHCLRFAKPIWVSFGDPIGGEGGPTVAPVDFEAHPDFCGRTQCGDEAFDYGYVELGQTVDVAPSPMLLRQSDWDQAMHLGGEVILVGYGVDEPDGQDIDGYKREVTTEITDFTDDRLQFRAGKDGRDSCRGDSGGPAFVRTDAGTLLAGVLSEGTETCGSGGWYGIPLAVVAWLEEREVFSVENGCSELDCIERIPSEGGCAVAGHRPHRAPLFAGLVLLGLAARRRRSRRGA